MVYLEHDWKVGSKPIMRSKRAYNKCFNCACPFSRIKSKKTSYRHHCRICGEMYCRNCTTKLKLPNKYWKGKKREAQSTVCYGCYYNAIKNKISRGDADEKTEKFFDDPKMRRFSTLSKKPNKFTKPNTPARLRAATTTTTSEPARPNFKINTKKPVAKEAPVLRSPMMPSTGRMSYTEEKVAETPTKPMSYKLGSEDLTDVRYARPFGYGVDLSILQARKKARDANLPSGRSRIKSGAGRTKSQPNSPSTKTVAEIDPESAMRKKLPALIAATPFVKTLNLDEKQLGVFADSFNYRQVPKGEKVFNEGEIGQEELYLVYSGSFTVHSLQKKGNKTIEKQVGKRNLKKGDAFGELAMTCEIFPRAYTVVAKKDSEVVSISQTKLRQFLLKIEADTFKQIKQDHVQALFRDLGVYLFDMVPDDKMVELADLCELEEVLEGENLYNRQDPVGGLDYVISGLLEVDDILIGPGQYFGEKALSCAQTAPYNFVARERTLVLKLDGQAFCQLFTDCLEKYATFALQVAQSDVPLLPVITHRMGHDYFKEYLHDNLFMHRHIEFVDEVKKFQKLTEEKQHDAALELAKRFIDADAPDQINISGQMRRRTQRYLQGVIDYNVFEAAVSNVMELMTQDFLITFKTTKDFKNLLQVVGKHKYPDNSTHLPLPEGGMMMIHGGQPFSSTMRSDVERLIHRIK